MFSIFTKLKQWLLAQSGFLGSETTVSDSNSLEYDLFPTPGRKRTPNNLPDYLQDEPWMDNDEVLEMFRPYVEKIIVSQNAAVRTSPPESEEEGLMTMEEWHQYLEKRKQLGGNTNSCNL
ncbi:predicted protein [Chaetoceros tenuissimus]|uniref:Uncharacterized protein n=1 Tax=Chaetoceros tenuissimus TaxID=426638 RepID=A0AAD3HBY1_9STRA|nr:predicted protein [Chaetoceros tenuissimus]